jgi:hypothetical protein
LQEADLLQTIQQISGGDLSAVARKPLRVLLECFEEVLGVEIEVAALRSFGQRSVELARKAVSVGVFGLVSYVVIGGILEGKSALSSNPYAVLACLAVLMVVLAAFEGLQISVALLRLVDPQRLRGRYSRAYALHRAFRSEEGTRRFLAGRQLFVIVVVFFAARATSLEGMTYWPFTGAAFPHWMLPWFRVVFLELGVGGALFVLWFAQLASQFFANKRPLAWLNLPGMNLVFRLSLAVESLGLTRPGDWLTKRLRPEPRIPMSLREAYRQASESIKGYALLGLQKEWNVGASAVGLRQRNTIEFYQDDFERVREVVEYRTGARKASFLASLEERNAGIIGRTLLWDLSPETEQGWQRVTWSVKPNVGTFSHGDVVHLDSQIEFDCSHSSYEDIIRITQPTACVVFRIRFCDSPQSAGPVHVTALTEDETTGRLTRQPPIQLELRVAADGEYRAEYSALYPEVGTYFQFTWSVSHAT